MKILSKIKSVYKKIRASNFIRLLIIAKKLNNRYTVVEIRKERKTVHAKIVFIQRQLKKSTGFTSYVLFWRRRDNKILEKSLAKNIEDLKELEAEFAHYRKLFCSNPVKRRALDISQIGLKEVIVVICYSIYLLSIIPRMIMTNFDGQDMLMEVYSVSLLFALFYFTAKVVRRKID